MDWFVDSVRASSVASKPAPPAPSRTIANEVTPTSNTVAKAQQVIHLCIVVRLGMADTSGPVFSPRPFVVGVVVVDFYLKERVTFHHLVMRAIQHHSEAPELLDDSFQVIKLIRQ